MNYLKSYLGKISNNKIMANSLNLMLASGANAAFGFLFWIIIARYFHSEAVGIATTLLSIATLLSLMSLVGFDSIFLRFLSKAKDKNVQINNGLLISGIVSASIAILFCLLTPVLSPKLSSVVSNGWNLLVFVGLTTLMTWNALTNAILIAYRRTSFVLGTDIIFSIIKLSLPLVVISGGAMSILLAIGLAQLINVVLRLAVLIKYFGYIPSLRIKFNSLKNTLRFGTAVYISNIFNLLPASVLPIIVINNLGATSAAYYYIAFAIANLLYTIAYTTNQVLLAESAFNEKNFKENMRKGLKIVFGLLTPAIIVTIIFCPFALKLFGSDYSNGASNLLRIMSFAGFVIMIYSFLNFIFKQTKNLRGVLVMGITNALVIILLSIVFIKSYGLVGIGWAWLTGTSIATIIGLFTLLISKKKTLNVAQTPIRFLITHFYSRQNNGDAALLSVLIKDVKREFKHASIKVVATDPTKENETFDGSSIQSSFMYYAMNKFTNKVLTLIYAIYVMTSTLLWAYIYKYLGLSLPINKKLRNLCLEYARADLIVPVGGGYLRGQNRGIGSLLYVTLMLHPIKLAYVLNKPTVMYTQSIGPFSNKLEERLVSYVINHYVEATILREDVSMKLLVRIGVNNDVYRGRDSGFGLTSKNSTFDPHSLFGIQKDKLIVGITAKKYFKRREQEKYERALAETAKYIVTNYNTAVVFIPQVTAAQHGDDDRVVHARIKQYINDVPNVYSYDKILNHHAIKSVYDSIDLLIGTRFHSVIFSLTSFVPAIAVEYEHKTRGIMQDLSLENWVIKIEDVNNKTLCKLVDKLVSERITYKNYLKQVMPEYIDQTNSAIKIVHDYFDRFYQKSINVEIESNLPASIKLPTMTKAEKNAY